MCNFFTLGIRVVAVRDVVVVVVATRDRVGRLVATGDRVARVGAARDIAVIATGVATGDVAVLRRELVDRVLGPVALGGAEAGNTGTGAEGHDCMP